MDYDPFMRYPRTTQEKRANQDGIWNRPKRASGRLPDSYWDIFVRKEKCWKYSRNTQYYPKKME